MMMMFSQTQYVYIHDALDEFITCGETEIAAANMRIMIGKLRRLAPGSKAPGFQTQFEVCS